MAGLDASTANPFCAFRATLDQSKFRRSSRLRAALHEGLKARECARELNACASDFAIEALRLRYLQPPSGAATVAYAIGQTRGLPKLACCRPVRLVALEMTVHRMCAASVRRGSYSSRQAVADSEP